MKLDIKTKRLLNKFNTLVIRHLIFQRADTLKELKDFKEKYPFEVNAYMKVFHKNRKEIEAIIDQW